MKNHNSAIPLYAMALCLASCAFGDAITPGILTATPTINCVGLLWQMSGDSNMTAGATVEYRKVGDVSWLPAFPMTRQAPVIIDAAANTIGGVTCMDGFTVAGHPAGMMSYMQLAYAKNYLGSSVLNLTPGTAYEFKTTMVDPDGGSGTATVTATTRTVPKVPANGTRIQVSGDSNAIKTAIAAYGKAGNILVVHAGTYKPFTVINVKAPADSPFCIIPAGDGDVIIHGPTAEKLNQAGQGVGISVSGCTNVIIQGLLIKSFYTGIYFNSSDCAIIGCNISGVWEGMMGYGNRVYISDNVIRGVYTNGTEGEGVEVKGVGNVICYNTFKCLSDGISLGLAYNHSDCDVHNNLFYANGDDGIELDFCGPNIRIWENSFIYSGCNSISYQPYIGGPAYVVRNVIYDNGQNVFKDRYSSKGLVMLNNTCVNSNNGFHSNGAHLIMQTYGRNNLFYAMRDTGSCMAFRPEDLLRYRPRIVLDMDYNGYGTTLECKTVADSGWYKWPSAEQALLQKYRCFLSLDSFQSLTGLEAHGLAILRQNCFAQNFVIPPCSSYHYTDTVTALPDLTLKTGSQAIDKGVAIPNLVETFSGAAPDLGALEYGAAHPQWGPRASTAVLPRFSLEESMFEFGVSPNPFSGGTRIFLPLPEQGTRFYVDVYDTQGKKVRSLFAGTGGMPGNEITWDGKSDSGKPLAKGSYIIRLKTARNQTCERVMYVN